jgi:hypothetical protein
VVHGNCKHDLLFLAEQLTAMPDERRLSVLIRQHGIGKLKDDAIPAKLPAEVYMSILPSVPSLK